MSFQQRDGAYGLEMTSVKPATCQPFLTTSRKSAFPSPQAPPPTLTISSVRGGWRSSMEDGQKTADREQQTLTAFRDSQQQSPLLEPPSTSELEDYCGIKILRDYVAFTPPHLIEQLALPRVCTTSKRRSQSESSIALTHEFRSCQMEKIRGVRFISKTASSLAPASL